MKGSDYIYWETESFAVDTQGWQAVFVDTEKPSEYWVCRVVGWLTQQEIRWPAKAAEDERYPTGTHRVVAGVNEFHSVDAVDEAANFCGLVPPGASIIRFIKLLNVHGLPTKPPTKVSLDSGQVLQITDDGRIFENGNKAVTWSGE